MTCRYEAMRLTWPDVGRTGRSVQIDFGWTIERSSPAINDPEFAARLKTLRERMAENPGRPLILVMGSSRNNMGVDAGQLTRTRVAPEPIVFNFAIPTSGPMFQAVIRVGC